MTAIPVPCPRGAPTLAAMAPLWFRAKRYGYGWYPATWEGWLVTLGYTALVTLPIPLIPALGEKDGSLFALVFLSYVIALTVLLLWTCVRTGEKAGWRWGN